MAPEDAEITERFLLREDDSRLGSVEQPSSRLHPDAAAGSYGRPRHSRSQDPGSTMGDRGCTNLAQESGADR